MMIESMKKITTFSPKLEMKYKSDDQSAEILKYVIISIYSSYIYIIIFIQSEEYSINLSEIQSEISLPIFRAIKKSDDNTITSLHKQIIDAAGVVFKTDTDFYTKLRNIFLKNFKQVMSDTQDGINNLFKLALNIDIKKNDK